MSTQRPSPADPSAPARTRRATGVVTALVIALVATLTAPAPAGAAPAGTRFLDPVFAQTATTSDLLYGTAPHHGQPFDLKLDIHEPLGDTAERRPLLVWFHGGSFQVGDKAGPLEVIMARTYAQRGYVVASVGYRLASGNLGTDLANAFADARTAVAWLRANADTYRIDTDRIAAAGMSAGAFIAVSLGAQDDVVAHPELLDGPSHVDAVVSLAGAGMPDWAQPGEAPVLMHHGVDDEVVPYALAAAYCTGAVDRGLPCELVDYHASGGVPATHVGFLGFLGQIVARTSAFLHLQLGLASWSPVAFGDVPPGTTFHDDVAWAATTGVALGHPGSLFRPTDVVTRQQMAGFLHRLSDHLGGPDAPDAELPFTDVDPASDLAADVAWLAATGITHGVPGPSPDVALFHPATPVSRQQMAAFLHRLDQLLGGEDPPSPDPGFLDVPGTSPFHPAVAWMADAGITTGYPGPTYRPARPVTRQQMVAFLHRLAVHVVGAPA